MRVNQFCTGDDHTVKIRLKHSTPTRDHQINITRKVSNDDDGNNDEKRLCAICWLRRKKRNETKTRIARRKMWSKPINQEQERNMQCAIKVPHTENAHVQIVLSPIIRWQNDVDKEVNERKKSIRIHTQLHSMPITKQDNRL